MLEKSFGLLYFLKNSGNEPKKIIYLASPWTDTQLSYLHKSNGGKTAGTRIKARPAALMKMPGM